MTYQMTLYPEEYLEQANALCEAEWIISPFIHNLVFLVAQEYQKRDIPPEKFDYVTIPERALFSYSVDSPGETYYSTVRELFSKIADARILFRHSNGDIEQVQIFRGRTYYSKKNREIKICLNQDLYDFWMDLHALYAKLPLTDMLSLPNTKYARLMYQLVGSFKYLGQKEMDFEALKRIMHCEKMLAYDFKRIVLSPTHKAINQTSLKFDYELVRGARNKIEKIRFIFPGVTRQLKATPSEVPAKDLDADVTFGTRQGTSITRKTETIIAISNGGFIDCWQWVREQKGTWDKTDRQEPKIIFSTKELADRFVAICKKCNIPVA